ncbi:MAG: penicillin-binding transpeptidase domain-containing protein [Clostridia bacterium]
MKKIRNAIRVVSVLLVCAFAFVGCWMAYTTYTQRSRWLATPYNTRLNAARKTTGMGAITDRNGITLAKTLPDGTRAYAADERMRRAVSQTVGDQMSMSGTGVETFHAGTLLGMSGSIIDRTFQYVTGKNFQGDNLKLTVDAQLSAYISEQFPRGKEGAVALINYQTGEILAMVSKPDYDPVTLANRQADANFSGSGYLNRCLQGQYAPGSAFKVVTLAAALEAIPEMASRLFLCDGPRAFGPGQVTCYGGEIHGEMSLWEAFSKSCNVTFASIANELGEAQLRATAEKMGFNDNFMFRDVVLYESSMPEKMADASELAWTGVGQGKLLVTPMHMAMIAGAVANGGIMREPQLVAQVSGVGNIPRLRAATGIYGQVMSPNVARLVGLAMQRTVEQGTATKARIKGYTVCGKTGTAETSDDKSVKTNAWFIGYIANEAHPYAIAVVVEQGGTGGAVAAPLAAKVFKQAIAQDAPAPAA